MRNTILYALVQQDTTRCQKKNNITMPTAICYSASNLIPFDKIEYFTQHVPVKFSYTANTLSWAPLEIEFSSLQLQDQDADPECPEVKKYCLTGWPTRKNVPANLIPYWKARNDHRTFHYFCHIVPVPLCEKRKWKKCIKKLNVGACEQILLFGGLV